MKLYWITYTVSDPDTGEVYEERDSPLPVNVEKSPIPKELKTFLKNAGAGSTGEVLAKKPFGERRPDLINIIPLKQFLRNNVRPYPGLVVDVDNLRGTVKTVGGGRVVVDFNHPLSGRDLKYTVKVVRIEEDIGQIVKSLCEFKGYLCDTETEKDKVKVTIRRKDGKDITDSDRTLVKVWLSSFIDGYEITVV